MTPFSGASRREAATAKIRLARARVFKLNYTTLYITPKCEYGLNDQSK